MRSKILVSACLMGFNVRYNGTKKGSLQQTLAYLQQEQRLVILAVAIAYFCG